MKVSRVVVWLLRVGTLAVLVAAWVYATGPGGVSPLVLPYLQDVLAEFASAVADPATWSNVLVTLAEFGMALAVGVTFGLFVGFLGSRTRLRSEILEPLMSWGYMAPLELLFPVFTLWFGVGIWSKVLFAALACFFPVVINTVRGFQSVRATHLNAARAFGASSRQVDWLVKLPAAAPMVLSGVRIGAALSMINVVLGEMLSSQRGLGYELAKASQTFAPARAFAMILLLMVVIGVLHPILQRLGTMRGGTR